MLWFVLAHSIVVKQQSYIKLAITTWLTKLGQAGPTSQAQITQG